MGGRGRAPCCDKSKVNKGPWSPAEDLRLITFIQKHGHGNWRHLPQQAGLLRCGKSCRLRWINYLRPDVKRGNFTKAEEESIIKLHQSLGNKWSKIASYLPGRTDNEIKNVWNTHLKKRTVAKKDVDCAKDDKTKEFSTTSSPSPSSSTIDDPKEASSFSSISSCESNHSNSNQVDVSMPKQKSGSPFNSDDQVMIEIPSESDTDFWDMLDTLDPFQSSKSEPHKFEASQSSIFGEEHGHREIECRKWLEYLENELGLVDQATSDGGHNHGYNSSKNAAGELELGSSIMLSPEIDYGNSDFQMWPSSPHSFGMI